MKIVTVSSSEWQKRDCLSTHRDSEAGCQQWPDPCHLFNRQFQVRVQISFKNWADDSLVCIEQIERSSMQYLQFRFQRRLYH